MTKPMMVLLMGCAVSIASVAAEDRTYGAPMPDGEAMGIAAAVADADGLAGTPAKFSGRITQVCQKMGCWVILEDNGEHARVMARDHAYGIPTDSTGRAEVYGVMEVREISQEQADHFAEDAGQTGEVALREYRITADSIVLLD